MGSVEVSNGTAVTAHLAAECAKTRLWFSKSENHLRLFWIEKRNFKFAFPLKNGQFGVSRCSTHY